jgi:hypothetical protein
VVKAKMTDGSMLLGLSKMNIERLMEGKPIKFEGKDVGHPGDIIIMYGETEEKIVEEILRHSDTSGNG